MKILGAEDFLTTALNRSDGSKIYFVSVGGETNAGMYFNYCKLLLNDLTLYFLGRKNISGVCIHFLGLL